jgi:hypothetical protein
MTHLKSEFYYIWTDPTHKLKSGEFEPETLKDAHYLKLSSNQFMLIIYLFIYLYSKFSGIHEKGIMVIWSLAMR